MHAHHQTFLNELFAFPENLLHSLRVRATVRKDGALKASNLLQEKIKDKILPKCVHKWLMLLAIMRLLTIGFESREKSATSGFLIL